MDLFLGEEKNIFQSDDLGVEMVEIDEMCLYKQLQT
jgi:hypothetical protein